jgi:hypothetical protein
MPLARALSASLVLAFFAASAHAAPMTFTATLSVSLGNFFPGITANGSGAGDTGGAGGTATIPAGAFSIGQTAALPFPIGSVIFGVGVAKAGQLGANTPLLAGSNLSLQFGGTTGTMGLDASAYLLNKGNKAIGAIPIGGIGGGTGAVPFSVLALISGTVFAQPYQLGMVTTTGNFLSGMTTAFATGFDNRDAFGNGTLQLVSPTRIDLGALGSVGSIAILTIQSTVVPEPGTLLLVGAGLAALGGLARRREG